AILAAAANAPAPRTLVQATCAMASAHVGTLLSQASEWRALLFLERRISSPATYREIYCEYVALFRSALVAASDWPAGLDPERAAFNAFSIVDAMAKQGLLVQDVCPDADELVADVVCAVTGYLQAAQGAAGAVRA
ncbi:MAG TPA: hypothetical protein VJN68_00065, partial [Burkholderiaceae bacterium]|nr:hypothetical protein [Burkholderiaceae bacterium]